MGDPRAILEESFAPLDPALRREVVAYLRAGLNVRFPSELNEVGRRAVSAIEPRTRADFHLQLESVDDATLVRLGRLMAVVGRDWGKPEHVPASIWALLRDACSAVFSGWRLAPEFTTMSIGRMRRLLELEGVMPSAVDGMLIDILVGTSTRAAIYEPRELQTIPGTAEFLADRVDTLYDRTHHFSERAHLEVVRLASVHAPLALAIAELLAAYTTSPDKDVRAAALAVVASLPVEVQVAVLEELLEETPSPSRARVIAAIERIPDTPAAIGLLERALARAKGARASELDRSIQRLAIFELAGAPPEASFPPFEPMPEHPLDDASVDSMRVALVEDRERQRGRIERLRKERAEFLRAYPGAVPGNELEFVEGVVRAEEASVAQLPAIVEYLSGRAPHPGRDLLVPLLGVRERLVGLEPVNWARMSAAPTPKPGRRHVVVGQERVRDARATADVLVRSGCSESEAHRTIIESYFVDRDIEPTLTAAQLVPYMAENPEVFDIVLGIVNGVPPQTYDDQTSRVLAVLEESPVLATRYLPVVTGLAIGTARTFRRDAQRVLERHGLADRVAQEALRGSSVDARTAAVLWIGSLGNPGAVELLESRLDAERSAAVRATIIGVLERLGRDIRGYLTPELLEAEAVAGMDKGVPAGLVRFPFDALPACRYANGHPVPPVVLRWWIVLAFTLKDPTGAGLLPLYLRSLDDVSAAALGRFVLATWVARDSSPIDRERAMHRAMDAVSRYARRATSLFGDYTELSSVVDELLDMLDREREQLANAVPSAIGEKGVLALTPRVPGPELAEIVRQFMRRQHLKRAQIEALLHVLSQSDEPEPLQLLVSTARRYRTTSLQESARGLVALVAGRRGWTPDELADRMIPTAGLDEHRSARFDYGPRSFVGRFGSGLVLALESEEGEPLRSLPTPRADDVLAPSAKAALAAARKELTAVVTLQRRRLYDAMCLRREWTGADWREFVLGHPVVGVLAAALVWHVDDAVGRPDLGGVVRAADGSEVVVAPQSRVTVAHTTTLPATEIAAWSASPSGIALGFEQFRAMPVDVDGAAARRDDLDGVPSESFTVRSRLTRAEWSRGATGDDVRFDEYVKQFDGVGLTAAISFSGSQLPETSIPVQLGSLTVRRATARGSAIPFNEVPPALLAELVADYLSLGA